MAFLSGYNFSLYYRYDKDNANADFLSRLPLSPNEEEISGSYALSDPDDLGVYLTRACGIVPSFCPIPDIGLGGLIPQPDPSILSVLPLTHDDFRTHRAPLPPPHKGGSIDLSHLVSAGNPRSPYAVGSRRPPL